MDSYDDDVLGVAQVLGVGVGLVLHGRAVLGGLNHSGVDDCAVLHQLDVDLVAVEVDGLDRQLVVLLKLQRRAGGEGPLLIVVEEHPAELLIDHKVVVGGVVVEVGCLRGSLDVSGEVLLGHEADGPVLAPLFKVEVILLGHRLVNDAVRLVKSVAGDGQSDALLSNVVVDVVVETGELLWVPSVGRVYDLGHRTSDFHLIDCAYCHRRRE